MQTAEAMIRQYNAEIQRIKQAFRERYSTGGMIDRVLVGLALFGPDHRLVDSVQTDEGADPIGRISSVKNLGETTLNFYTDEQVDPAGRVLLIENEAVLHILRGRVESTLQETVEPANHSTGLIIHRETTSNTDGQS